MIRDCPGTRTCHVRPRSAAYALRGKPQPHYLLTYLLTYAFKACICADGRPLEHTVQLNLRRYNMEFNVWPN